MSTTVRPLTRQSTDHSDRAGFGFSFYCDRCGREWRSETVPFGKRGFTEVVHREAEDLLWTEEHRIAFERANLEAVFHFNSCPECGRWVCDDCLHKSEDGDKVICGDCATKETQTIRQG